MADNKKTDIIIGGNVFTITGRDAASKGPKIAELVNDTIYKVKTMQSSRNLSWDYVMTLASINLADMALSVQKEAEELRSRVETLERKMKKLDAKMAKQQAELMSLEQENIELSDRLKEGKQ